MAVGLRFGCAMSARESFLPIRSDEHQLLSARILNADDRFAVYLTTRAEVGDDDLIRFALHYYARALFELVRTARSARELPAVVDAIAAVSLGRDSDVFAIAAVNGSLERTIDDARAVEADCVLSSTAHREFHLRGDFSRLNTRALIRSVIAVIQSVLQRLSPEMIDTLTLALANMNASYGVTHRYSDAHSLDQVPANAYHAASFI